MEVATGLLAGFTYDADDVRTELRENADWEGYEQPEGADPAAPVSLSAYLRLADRAVTDELRRRGLPPVSLAAESVCGDDRDQRP